MIDNATIIFKINTPHDRHDLTTSINPSNGGERHPTILWGGKNRTFVYFEDRIIAELKPQIDAEF